ncbi:hypothetical protein SAMN03159453_06074 [Pseudomonas sp. NFIX28]|nr:hypothetical protein SAMN03159453_06074 [Pseudomonas sp. NFIX28]
MRERKSARLRGINPSRKVLLFRFLHKEGALAGDAGRDGVFKRSL